jgi:hypothetical protein
MKKKFTDRRGLWMFRIALVFGCITTCFIPGAGPFIPCGFAAAVLWSLLVLRPDIENEMILKEKLENEKALTEVLEKKCVYFRVARDGLSERNDSQSKTMKVLVAQNIELFKKLGDTPGNIQDYRNMISEETRSFAGLARKRGEATKWPIK